MAKIQDRPTVQLTFTIQLNEQEARALESLAGYSIDSILDAIGSKISQSIVRDHKEGLTSLVESVRQILPGILQRTDDARKVFTGERIAAYPPKKEPANA